MKNQLAKWYFSQRMKAIEKWVKQPWKNQLSVLNYLIENGRQTEFGKNYDFNNIKNPETFQQKIPLQDYETLKGYLTASIKGKQNQLWNKPIRWFAMSSGTTVDRSKYIPVTDESLQACHYRGGKDMLALYLNAHPKSQLFKGKSFALGGSRQMNALESGMYTGDISSIIISNLPSWAQYSRTPSKEITLMADWNEKLEKLMTATASADISSISGVPSWMLVFLQSTAERYNKAIHQLWPNLEVFFHGGVGFSPYEQSFKTLIPDPKMNYWETYNASEGFFGLQFSGKSKELILLTNHSIFYEFVPIEHSHKTNPKTILLPEVEVGKTYELIISTNAGLWRYRIGVTICFTSTNPHLFTISGRTKAFINIFGEELMIHNAEKALSMACTQTAAVITEYTAAPFYNETQKPVGHEWAIEFEKMPNNLAHFIRILDESLCSLNSDYAAKRSYNLTMVLPKVKILPKGTFQNWLSHKGKLGGQNKIPRLSNSREFIEELL